MPKYKAGLKRFFGKKKKPNLEIVNINVADPSKPNVPRSSEPSTGRRIRKTTPIVVNVGPISVDGAATPTPTPTIVCDLGSAWIRMGFASQRLPSVETPSWVGRLPAGKRNGNDKFFALGEEAQQIRDESNVLKPIKRGRIEDLDAVSFLLDDGFRRIGALTAQAEDLTGNNLLLALRPSERLRTNEQLFQTLMETYRPDGCHFTFQQPLALFACARMTGLVLDSGEGVTHAVPVYCGHAVRGATQTVNLGGQDVTSGLASCLAEQWDFRVRSLRDRALLDRLKERLTLISPKPGQPPTEKSDEGFHLPDGRKVVLGDERYLCAEPLFNPQLLGGSGVGVATAVALALRRCPPVAQREIGKSIFPLGGNCRLKGFDERLEEELWRKYPGLPQVCRVVAAARQTAVWRGGAAWARTPRFPSMVVTSAEYEEEGIRAFRRKCFIQANYGGD